MKAIIWLNRMHILGENTVVEVNETQVVIDSPVGRQFLNFKDIPPLMDKITTNVQFSGLIIPLVFNIFSQFISDPKMGVLDLVGSLLQSRIEPAVSPNGLVNGIDHAN